LGRAESGCCLIQAIDNTQINAIAPEWNAADCMNGDHGSLRLTKTSGQKLPGGPASEMGSGVRNTAAKLSRKACPRGSSSVKSVGAASSTWEASIDSSIPGSEFIQGKLAAQTANIVIK
jgi:hypothetical protein